MAKIKLTDRFVKSVKHSGKHKVATFHDTLVTGFIVEVAITGRKTFYKRYYLNGKTRVQRIADASLMTVTSARSIAKKIQRDLDLGKDLYAEKQIIKSVPTLQRFYIDYYLPHIKQRNRSWQTTESVFRIHILPRWGRLKMVDINRLMVTQAHNDLLAKGLKPATANKLPTFVRGLYNLAIKWETTGILVNPAANFEFSEENNKVERYLTKKEAARLMQAVNNSEAPKLKYIVTFLLLTGARRGECLNAMWKNFDFNNLIWTIPLAKSGKSHHVPITSHLQTLLRSIPKEKNNPYVFPSPSTGKPYTNIYQSWNNARIKAGLKDVRMHDLRHTFASTLVNSGRSLYEVMNLLGHHNITVTQRYSHLSNESLVDAANCAASLLPD